MEDTVSEIRYRDNFDCIYFAKDLASSILSNVFITIYVSVTTSYGRIILIFVVTLIFPSDALFTPPLSGFRVPTHTLNLSSKS